jgi:hypothetical protein
MAAGNNFAVWDANAPENQAYSRRMNAEAAAKAAIYELARDQNFHYPSSQINNAELQSLLDHMDRQPDSLALLEDLQEQWERAAAGNQPIELGFWESLGGVA